MIQIHNKIFWNTKSEIAGNALQVIQNLQTKSTGLCISCVLFISTSETECWVQWFPASVLSQSLGLSSFITVAQWCNFSQKRICSSYKLRGLVLLFSYACGRLESLAVKQNSLHHFNKGTETFIIIDINNSYSKKLCLQQELPAFNNTCCWLRKTIGKVQKLAPVNV